MKNSICRLHISLLLLLLPHLFLNAQELQVRVVDSWQAGMIHPTDLAVTPDGQAWVVDGLNQRLLRIRGGSTQAQSLRFPQFGMLLGIYADEQGIVLSDTKQKKLHFLDLQGKWIRSLKLPDSCDPVDVYRIADRLVVSDNDNHRLLFLSSDGKLLRTIGRDGQQFQTPTQVDQVELALGESGQGAGEFTYPGIISAHGKGFIVVDVLGGRIQSFSVLGNFERAFGSFSTSGEGLFRPKGTCLHKKSKRVFATDGFAGTVTVYDSWGTRLGYLSEDGKPLVFDGPTAIEIPELDNSSGKQTGAVEYCWLVDNRASKVYRLQLL